MANEYFQVSGWPATGSKGSSASSRAARASVEDAFDKMPVLTAKANLPAFVNASGTALETLTAAAARAALNLEIGADVNAYDAELAAIGGLTKEGTTVQSPRFSGSETAEWMTIYNLQSLLTANGASVQQTIKTYIDALSSSKGAVLEAPSGTKAFAYNADAPSGWTVGTGVDNRIIMIHATLTGAFGTNAIDSNQDSGIQSAHHTHTVTTTAYTSVAPRFTEMTGGNYLIADEHSHSISVSAATSQETQDHDHQVAAAKGLYVIQITKT